MKSGELYSPLDPATVTVAVVTALPLQNVSVGPERRNVIVPVGLKPVRWAVSWIAPPTGTPGDAVVVSAAVNGLTMTLSLGSLHEVGPTGLFAASPL